MATIRTTPTGRDPSTFHAVAYLVYFIFGFIEVILAFRLLFKIAGANPVSYFVQLIYTLTQIFIMPFEGIFRRGYTQGVETASVFEPSTLVAMAVYPLIGWGIVKLISIFVGRAHEV